MAKGRKRSSGRRGRKGMGTEQRCGCKVVAGRVRGRRPVVMCPGTPMLKILSRKQAASHGKRPFCTKMLKPFRRRGR